MLTTGHAGHPRQSRGKIGETLKYRLEEGNKVHQPGACETWRKLIKERGTFAFPTSIKMADLGVHSTSSRMTPVLRIHSFGSPTTITSVNHMFDSFKSDLTNFL